MTRSHIFSVLATAVLFCVPVRANYLTGTEVSFRYMHPTTSTVYGPWQYIVGPAVERANGISDAADGLGNVDFLDTEIRISFAVSAQWTPSEFNGFELHISPALAPIRGAYFLDGTDSQFVQGAALSFTDHSMVVNWSGLYLIPGNKVLISIIPSVPEPGTNFLFALGISALGIYSRFLGRQQPRLDIFDQA